MLLIHWRIRITKAFLFSAIALSIIFALILYVHFKNQGSATILIYGLPSNSPTFSTEEAKVVFHNVNEKQYFDRFVEIIKLLYTESKIPIAPEDVCVGCLLVKGYKLEDVFIMYDTPLIGVFRDGKLCCVIIGVADETHLERIISECSNNGAKVFTLHGGYFPISGEVGFKIEELFLKG